MDPRAAPPGDGGASLIWDAGREGPDAGAGIGARGRAARRRLRGFARAGCAGHAAPRSGAHRRARRSAHRRPRPAGRRGISGEARKGAERQGPGGRDQQCRGVRRHHLGRARPPRLVGAGGDRCRHPRARRQRHAARPRSANRPQGAAGHPEPPEGTAHRGAAVRDAGGAQSGRRLRARVQQRSIRIWPRPGTFCSIRSSWRASSTTRSWCSATACIRPPPASTPSWPAFSRKPRRWSRACTAAAEAERGGARRVRIRAS